MAQVCKLSSLLLRLNPYEFTALSIILGTIFTEGLNSNQMQALGNFFESIGQTMITIGMQTQNLNDTYNIQWNYEEMISILKSKINNIENIINKIKNMDI